MTTESDTVAAETGHGVRLELVANGPFWTSCELVFEDGVRHPLTLTPEHWAALDAALDRQFTKNVVVEAARAWRAQRNFTYRPGEINPYLVTAHHEDLDLAAAVVWYRFERDLKREQRRHEAELDEIRRGAS